MRSATITLVDASKMDALHQNVNVLLKNRLSGVETMDTRTLQAYHRDNDPHVFFDLADMIHQSTNQATPAFDKALSDAVLYKGNGVERSLRSCHSVNISRAKSM